jgi:DMSO/TMAO reductase YedYZ heme-binding membrane subunit
MNLTWFIIRGSGLAAFALLSASMIWGLMVSGKMLGRAVKAKGLQWLHESLGLAAVVSTLVHMIALSMDEFIDFTWFDILVPGVSTWEPLAVTLGVVSFWTLLAVSFSFYIKKWIGQAAWRSLHYLSFGAFAAALAHGVMAGTDTLNPWVAGGYTAAAVSVTILTIIRVVSSGTASRAATTPVRSGVPEA